MLRHSSRAGKSHWKHAVGARGRQESLLPAGIIPAALRGRRWHEQHLISRCEGKLRGRYGFLRPLGKGEEVT